MTGEIDNQGRITAIGALDIKLETAYDAGCRTMIIPRENLVGSEGLARLSEGLKDELQIFTYDEWSEHQGEFDYNKHMLQIVAVDHISQAADVAFIPEEEIERTRNAFSDHAEQTTGKLAAAKSTESDALIVYYLKDPREFDLTYFPVTRIPNGYCVGLLAPEMKEGDPRRLAALKDIIKTYDFDPTRYALSDMLETISTAYQQKALKRLVFVAPYYFLKSMGMEPKPQQVPAAFDEVLVFANNFTGYGFKIKNSKRLLNGCYWWLAQLEKEALLECPFLTASDGAQVADLSYIPEKFRLDTERAQQWFNNSLERWLQIVSGKKSEM